MRTYALLWFDVEKRYNTTNLMRSIDAVALWFDVEKRYNATGRPELSSTIGLWFDVEKRYNTTCPVLARRSLRCGLM